MEFNVKPNPDRIAYDEITEKVKQNDGFCPCKLFKNADTKCMCKEFKEQNTEGFCHCGRFLKVAKN